MIVKPKDKWPADVKWTHIYPAIKIEAFRKLQRGLEVEIPDDAALALISRGLVEEITIKEVKDNGVDHS